MASSFVRSSAVLVSLASFVSLAAIATTLAPGCTTTVADGPQVDAGPDVLSDGSAEAGDDDTQVDATRGPVKWIDGALPEEHLEVACVSIAEAECAMAKKCAGTFTLTRDFDGDDGACLRHARAACIADWAGLRAQSSESLAEDVKACGRAILAQQCEDWRAGATPDACAVTGSATAGTACGTNRECKSGYCARAAGASCGTCAALPQKNDACTTAADCAATPGLTCLRGTCGEEAKAGQACNASFPCAAGLSCVGVGDAGFGTCTAVIAKVGDACDATLATAPGCDERQGLFCRPDGKCAPPAWADTGRPCGWINGTLNLCSGGGTCVMDDGGTTGACRAHAHVGEACDLAHGRDCVAPTTCQNGVCAFADPTACK